MLITTTSSIDGHAIVEYKGVVFGEIIAGVNFVKDFMAGLTNIFGGRSSSYENEILNARNAAMQEMEQRAFQMGANAIVGVKVDYESLGEGGSMLMVTASGTAVVYR